MKLTLACERETWRGEKETHNRPLFRRWHSGHWHGGTCERLKGRKDDKESLLGMVEFGEKGREGDRGREGETASERARERVRPSMSGIFGAFEHASEAH